MHIIHLLHFLILICMCLYMNSWFSFANKVQYAISKKPIAMALWKKNKSAGYVHLVSNKVSFQQSNYLFCSNWNETRLPLNYLIEMFTKVSWASG
jgi:hypothetical protein